MDETTLPTSNVPLLRATWEQIMAHPERWMQSSWKCGTAYCVGGWIAKLDNGRWLPGEEATLRPRRDDPHEDRYRVYVEAHDRDEWGVDVEDRAQRVAGLTNAEALRLFNGANTLEDVRKALERVLARAGETL